MTTVVGLVFAGVVVAAMLVGRWVVRRRAAARTRLPPLFYSLAPQSSVKPSALNGTANGKPHSNGVVHANGASSLHGAARAFPTPPHHRPRTPAQQSAASFGDDYKDGETVRFYRPVEQSLQFLPGHLEVLEGTTRDREIRFVRVPGEPPEVILGRDPSPLPNTVGLGSPTVSRRHVRMDFADGCWHVKNLSRTNPLVVNDDEVSDVDAARPLADGDRLQLGAVVLRFHAQ